MYIELSKQATWASHDVCCNTHFPLAPFACCSCRYCFLYFIGRYCCLRPVAGIVGVYSSGSKACFLVTALKSSVFVFVSVFYIFLNFQGKTAKRLARVADSTQSFVLQLAVVTGTVDRWTSFLIYFNVFSLFWNCVFQSLIVLVICWHGALSGNFWISNQ